MVVKQNPNEGNRNQFAQEEKRLRFRMESDEFEKHEIRKTNEIKIMCEEEKQLSKREGGRSAGRWSSSFTFLNSGRKWRVGFSDYDTNPLSFRIAKKRGGKRNKRLLMKLQCPLYIAQFTQATTPMLTNFWSEIFDRVGSFSILISSSMQSNWSIRRVSHPLSFSSSMMGELSLMAFSASFKDAKSWYQKRSSIRRVGLFWMAIFVFCSPVVFNDTQTVKHANVYYTWKSTEHSIDRTMWNSICGQFVGLKSDWSARSPTSAWFFHFKNCPIRWEHGRKGIVCTAGCFQSEKHPIECKLSFCVLAFAEKRLAKFESSSRSSGRVKKQIGRQKIIPNTQSCAPFCPDREIFKVFVYRSQVSERGGEAKCCLKATNSQIEMEETNRSQ